jgi:hypothetical protein
MANDSRLPERAETPVLQFLSELTIYCRTRNTKLLAL